MSSSCPPLRPFPQLPWCQWPTSWVPWNRMKSDLFVFFQACQAINDHQRDVHSKMATKLAYLFDAHCQLLGNLLDTAWNQGSKALEICSDYLVWGCCVYCPRAVKQSQSCSVTSVTWFCRPKCIHASDCRVGMTGAKHSSDAKMQSGTHLKTRQSIWETLSNHNSYNPTAVRELPAIWPMSSVFVGKSLIPSYHEGTVHIWYALVCVTTQSCNDWDCWLTTWTCIQRDIICQHSRCLLAGPWAS